MSARVDEISYNDRSSLGFAFTYFTAEADREETGGNARYHYRSIPVRVAGKTYLGDVRGRAVGYVGAGLGVGFNRLERTTDLVSTSTYESSVSVGISAGALIAVGSKRTVDLGYTFNFLNDSFFTDDLAHVFTVALGFRR